MKNIRHPNFFLGLITIILALIGIGSKANGYEAGQNVLYAASVAGAVHWIWAIVDIIGRHDMKPFQKRFWLIAVVAVPIMGSMVFYVLHQAKDKIVT
jgi:hypothetical protein